MISKYLETIENDLQKKEVEHHEEKIRNLSEWIVKEQNNGTAAKLNFICTHNSRRSQFAQVWCTFVQDYFGLNITEAYSGGTEITACNERTVAALRRAGFNIEATGTGNPVYSITTDDSDTEIKIWSKLYDDESNPSDRFAAIMTCDHADANCPFIPGAAIRIPLTYTDPKYTDDTEQEETAYDETCKMIATDMIRLFKKVKALHSKTD